MAKEFTAAIVMGCISVGMCWTVSDEVSRGIIHADEMIKQLKEQ